MKKILIFLFSLSFFTVSSAKDVSEFFNNFVPGEGLTEAQIDFTDADDGEITFNILMLRNIEKTDTSNFFTQFSIQSQDVGQNDPRYVGNLGLGYRFLNDDNSLMIGANVFTTETLNMIMKEEVLDLKQRVEI